MTHPQKIALLFIAVFVAAAVFTSCKTSEANYRRAYEKAVAGRDSLTAIENTIYGQHRRSTSTSIAIAGADTADMISARVAVTEGGGGIKENLKPYNVVVGQFKQLINAKSLRERLVDAGYPMAFVVQTAEPYYYIILASYSTRTEAVKACARVRADTKFPIALREGLPVVLYTPR